MVEKTEKMDFCELYVYVFSQSFDRLVDHQFFQDRFIQQKMVNIKIYLF